MSNRRPLGDRPLSASNRRDFLKAGSCGVLGLSAIGSAFTPAAHGAIGVDRLPQEPLEIGHEPQFVFDLHAVDCTWSIHEKQPPVKRVFHPGKKHESNPLVKFDQPSNFTIARDSDGLFRMWYQINQPIEYPGGRPKGQPAFHTFVGYTQSKDGLEWDRPELDLFRQTAPHVPRNCVLYRPDLPKSGFHAPQLVYAPERDRRGYRYLLLYLGAGPDKSGRGIRLVGSPDGIHWDLEKEVCIANISSDHHNSIVYDPARKEYSLYLRAKHIYLAPGLGRDRIDAGQSRRGVARMSSPELWTEWTSQPQTIVVPDELDAEINYNFFYGMPTRHLHGIYWGFLQNFRMNDYMHSQLAWSRDGIHFDRLPTRPKLIEYGPDGSWDDTMLTAPPNWVEVGDEWWLYYNGWDGPHGTEFRTGGIGLATFRKEGFVSLRGPQGGGVVCTRVLRWPGGPLLVNADAKEGEVRVRVSDPLRKPLAGYNYEEGPTFTGDSVAQEIAWGGKSLDSLKGQQIRLEFFLKDADLYTFRAGGGT